MKSLSQRVQKCFLYIYIDFVYWVPPSSFLQYFRHLLCGAESPARSTRLNRCVFSTPPCETLYPPHSPAISLSLIFIHVRINVNPPLTEPSMLPCASDVPEQITHSSNVHTHTHMNSFDCFHQYQSIFPHRQNSHVVFFSPAVCSNVSVCTFYFLTLASPFPLWRHPILYESCLACLRAFLHWPSVTKSKN